MRANSVGSRTAAPGVDVHQLPSIEARADVFINVQRVEVSGTEVHQNHSVHPLAARRHYERIRVAIGDPLEAIEASCQALAEMAMSEHEIESFRVDQTAVREEVRGAIRFRRRWWSFHLVEARLQCSYDSSRTG